MVVKPSFACVRRASTTGRRAVAEHRAGIAQAEIDIGVAVGIGEVDALRRLDEERKRRSPVDHPVHRDAAQPMGFDASESCR